MNILVVNWTWYPSGGDWTYVENICSLYEQNGHRVIPFSMQDEKNRPSDFEKYFIGHIDYKELHKQNKVLAGMTVLTKSIYSNEAVHNLKQLLKEIKIDLAHLNIIHRYITPGILKVLKQAGIPIVWTLHDYTILCPESTFVSNGQICEACKGGKFYNAALKKCKKNSFLASSVAGLENYVHQFLGYYQFVDYFISPSKFHYEKFKEFGVFGDRLHQLYHSYDTAKFLPVLEEHTGLSERYILFVGRLEKIKGVQTLLRAMKECPDIRLRIAGDGTEEKDLKEFASRNCPGQVRFEGKKSRDQVRNLISQSDFLVCPSEWYEVLGFTIIEAMLLGKPVIGADIGAISETVIHEQTGLLYPAGDANKLAAAIQRLYDFPDLIKSLGNSAREHVVNLTNPDKHYQRLQDIIPALRNKDEHSD